MRSRTPRAMMILSKTRHHDITNKYIPSRRGLNWGIKCTFKEPSDSILVLMSIVMNQGWPWYYKNIDVNDEVIVWSDQ